jgi:chlorophyll/bacteriochlorophyll a synthase
MTTDIRQVTYPQPSAVLELLKPVTWFAPMWAFGCGVVSSGASVDGRWPFILLGILLTGPLVCATSQAVNDWYDRFVDALNEPNRPIPSGRIPGRWGFYIACGWTGLSLLVAALLGPLVLAAASIGLVLAWIYSAPPLRLKKNGWYGNLAVGLCYESLPWLTGAAVMAGGAMPDMRIVALALLYGLGAHGIMTLNDFKSVEGDRHLNLRSLPVQLGVQRAAELACAVMILPQFVVISMLISMDRLTHASIVMVLLAGQSLLMRHMLASPRARAIAYNATGTSLYVLGMLVAAHAIASVIGAGG